MDLKFPSKCACGHASHPRLSDGILMRSHVRMSDFNRINRHSYQEHIEHLTRHQKKNVLGNLRPRN